MLKVGQRSPEGVLLIAADPKQAVVEINGQQQQLTLSRQIRTGYKKVTKSQVSIRRNQANQYITQAKLNGKRVQVLVDTGANAIALSSQQADFLGIDYRGGMPGIVSTASGKASSYGVMLRSVDVGGIQVSGVQAFVIEGGFLYSCQ